MVRRRCIAGAWRNGSRGTGLIGEGWPAPAQGRSGDNGRLPPSFYELGLAIAWPRRHGDRDRGQWLVAMRAELKSDADRDRQTQAGGQSDDLLLVADGPPHLAMTGEN